MFKCTSHVSSIIFREERGDFLFSYPSKIHTPLAGQIKKGPDNGQDKKQRHPEVFSRAESV